MSKGFSSAKDLLSKNPLINKEGLRSYVHNEHQQYGLRLATLLKDDKHKALYIKLAKETPRFYLEQALSFTLDYPQTTSYAKIFMWKLKGLYPQLKLTRSAKLRKKDALKKQLKLKLV